MKKTVLKFIAFAILALNLLMVCLEVRNVKIILDEQSPLGVELDFSDAQLALKQMDSAANEEEEAVAKP